MRFEHIQNHNIHTCTFIHSDLRNSLNPEKRSKHAFRYRLLKSSDDALNDSWKFPIFFDIEYHFIGNSNNLKQSVLNQFKTFQTVKGILLKRMFLITTLISFLYKFSIFGFMRRLGPFRLVSFIKYYRLQRIRRCSFTVPHLNVFHCFNFEGSASGKLSLK